MTKVATIYPIIRQHAEGVAFLWAQRHLATDSQQIGEADLGRLDQRITAHQRGLAVAGADGWRAAKEHFETYPKNGEAFTLFSLALGSGHKKSVETALEILEPEIDNIRIGLSGALAWTNAEQLRPFIADWLRSKNALHRYLALCALSHNRVDATTQLAELMRDDDMHVRTRAVRLVGELGRVDLMAELRELLGSENEDEAYWASWSLCLLGSPQDTYETLETIAQSQSKFNDNALEMRLMSDQPENTRAWVKLLFQNPQTAQRAMRLISATHDRAIINWIIDQMKNPDFVENAGVAFRDYFEVDFDGTTLFTGDPAHLGKGFEKLDGGPFPIADDVEKWFKEYRQNPVESRFIPMRQQRSNALRLALGSPQLKLPVWQHYRQYPGWS